MARVMTFGFLDLRESLKKVGSLPKSVKDEMLGKAAKVYKRGIGEKAETMLHGEYYVGDVKNNIIIKPGEDKNSVLVTWPHNKVVHRKNADVATIAFVNEFGAPKRGIKARPFIKAAADENLDEAAAEMLDAWHDYVDKIL